MLSENFPGYYKVFKIISKLPRPSRHFQDYPKTLLIIEKLSRPSGNFPVPFQRLRAKTFRTRKNFIDTQKLSGHAKTFRMAIPRCLCGLLPFLHYIIYHQPFKAYLEFCFYFKNQGSAGFCSLCPKINSHLRICSKSASSS